MWSELARMASLFSSVILPMKTVSIPQRRPKSISLALSPIITDWSKQTSGKSALACNANPVSGFLQVQPLPAKCGQT